jgi:hypothetical protein
MEENLQGRVTQWTSIITVTIVLVGMIWTGITYIDKLSIQLEHLGGRLDGIDNTLRDIDSRSRIDHDKITELQYRSGLPKEPRDH